MSYQPENLDAAHCVGVMTTSTMPDGLAGLGAPYREAKHDAIRQMLVALVCPAPCVGFVNAEGWHKLCEAKADAAMTALSLWNSQPTEQATPDKES